MADPNRHLIIDARQTFPGEAHLPECGGAEPADRHAHSGEKTLDAEKIVRALISVYLRPPIHVSSCFHCW
jgi:hypothetical protein